MNALHHAAKWGHTNVLKYLLSSGRCKVNVQDKVTRHCSHYRICYQLLYVQYGWSPLHWASWNGHVSTILALLNTDHCNVNLTDKVSHLSILYSHYNDTIYTQTGSNALHGAAINGHAGVVRVLSPVKCDVDLQRKVSPTHY